MGQRGERNDACVDSRQRPRAVPRDLASTAVLERRVGFPTSVTLLFRLWCLLSFSSMHQFRHHDTLEMLEGMAWGRVVRVERRRR